MEIIMPVNIILFSFFAIFVLNTFNNQSSASNNPTEQADINKMVNIIDEEIESQQKNSKKTQKKINELPRGSEHQHASTVTGSSSATSTSTTSGSTPASRPKS